LEQNPQTIANSFNDYFLSVAEDLLEANQTDSMHQITNTSPLSDLLKSHNNPYPIMKFRYTSTKEREKIIKTLKSKDAHGYDEIPTKVLKWGASCISSPILAR
jgi:hypothetical protein